MKDFVAIAVSGLLGFIGATPADAVGVRHQNPVLLVHGIYDSAASMRVMKQWLKSQGWKVHELSLVPNDGRLPLEELARQVDTFVSATFVQGQKFDMVAFSMGGIVCRYYLQRMAGERRVSRFVQISSPNHGTWTASLFSKPGCVQMRRDSQFLKSLNSDVSGLAKVQFTTIWTPLDLVILPATSSVMPIGKNIRLWVLAHPLMVVQPSVFRAVANALSQAVPE
ncbi:MAG TPA: alpha/beta fold hydrolase [Chthoniobacterales bacterium]